MKNLKYIGPFFRMNSLSLDEISTQLFFLAKESVKSIVLESKCGIASSIKNYKRLASTNDISINSNISPLLCVYRRSSPNFIHSKNSNGFDEDTFKKDLNPSTNALMTLSLLELQDYYRDFETKDSNIYSVYKIYESLAKEQLEFYSVNLRDTEGAFTDKKNILENNYKNFNLIGRDKKFKFSDQGFMMLAYLIYAVKNPNNEDSESYKNFALEILQMFLDFKEKVYDSSLDELCKILFIFNILYDYKDIEGLPDLTTFLIDLADFAMNKFDEKDYYVDSLDTACFCCITLTLSYKHTKIISFLDKATEIIERLYSLYDSENEAFYKLSSKKEIKYTCLDITFYFLAFLVYADIADCQSKYKNIISSLYKKYFINSGIIPSWPEAPTLDDYERYRGLTLKSSDMLNESFFRMPNLPTPNSIGIAPIFLKSITYHKKKKEFTRDKITFDSYKNFFIFYTFIYLFKNQYINSNIVVAGDRDPDIEDEVSNPTDLADSENNNLTSSEDDNLAASSETSVEPEIKADKS